MRNDIIIGRRVEMGKKLKKEEVPNDSRDFDKEVELRIAKMEEKIFKGVPEARRRQVQKISSEVTRKYKRSMSS